MGFTMTPREALKIQAKQISHYARFKDNLKEIMAEKTDITGLELDEKYPVFEINKHIPRGGSIESICGLNWNQ